MAAYAIVKTGGKQYRVEKDSVVQVEKIDRQAGESVALEPIMYVSEGSVVCDSAGLAAVAVSAEVVSHGKGPKIRIHKFKNKTGYHKRQGHRQQLTELKITDIKQK